MEGKVIVLSREGGFIESRSSSYSYFCYELFSFTVGLCQDIEMLICKFWWGQRGERRKIHWKKPKVEGGLGSKICVSSMKQC